MTSGGAGMTVVANGRLLYDLLIFGSAIMKLQSL